MNVPRSPFRISTIALDEHSVTRRSPEIEQERAVAIRDLLEDNRFEPQGSIGGPYHLHLGITENRLVMTIRLEDGEDHGRLVLSLTPFRRVVRDYFLVCESYYAATREAQPSRLEALDMGRRGLHDEGSRLLTERLNGKVAVDFETARRLFTLICVLHLKG
jgi:uncharacterized protein (UPF0262 family)